MLNRIPAGFQLRVEFQLVGRYDPRRLPCHAAETERVHISSPHEPGKDIHLKHVLITTDFSHAFWNALRYAAACTSLVNKLSTLKHEHDFACDTYRRKQFLRLPLRWPPHGRSGQGCFGYRLIN